MQKNTSWGNVAEWYDDAVTDAESYQQKVILPNMLRLLAPKKSMTVLDLGCGQGFFSGAFAKEGATVIGVDVAPELIAIAEQHYAKELSPERSRRITFHVASADAVPFIHAKSVDAITIILALQNIAQIDNVFTECRRVLRPKGRLLIVLNHPAFRVPKYSSWGWEGSVVQYRRVDSYLSQFRATIEMHPGKEKSPTTVSFHRPLQLYFKAFAKHGFAVIRLEEWISHKTSQSGPRAKAEDTARKEIPLFLFLEATKL